MRPSSLSFGRHGGHDLRLREGRCGTRDRRRAAHGAAIRRWSEHALLVMLACAALNADAQQPTQSPSVSAVESEWARGNRLLLGVTQPALGFAAEWRFERSTTGDVFLERKENRGGSLEAGSMLLLTGRGALLAHGARLQPGRELDAMNGPLLMRQLVMRLLEQSVPDGPGKLGRDLRLDVSERTRTLSVTGIGTQAEFLAPWRLTGTIGPAGPGKVKFDLEFTSTARSPAGARYETSIVGIWQNAPPPVVFADDMPLRGWQVYQIKPVVLGRGAENIIGFGTSAPMGFPNLGAVRRRVAQWSEEQTRRSRWQCTG
jgi:hypothetical protein